MAVEVTNKYRTKTGRCFSAEIRICSSVLRFGQSRCGMSRCSEFETTERSSLEGEDEDA